MSIQFMLSPHEPSPLDLLSEVALSTPAPTSEHMLSPPPLTPQTPAQSIILSYLATRPTQPSSAVTEQPPFPEYFRPKEHRQQHGEYMRIDRAPLVRRPPMKKPLRPSEIKRLIERDGKQCTMRWVQLSYLLNGQRLPKGAAKGVRVYEQGLVRASDDEEVRGPFSVDEQRQLLTDLVGHLRQLQRPSSFID